MSSRVRMLFVVRTWDNTALYIISSGWRTSMGIKMRRIKKQYVQHSFRCTTTTTTMIIICPARTDRIKHYPPNVAYTGLQLVTIPPSGHVPPPNGLILFPSINRNWPRPGRTRDRADRGPRISNASGHQCSILCCYSLRPSVPPPSV